MDWLDERVRDVQDNDQRYDKVAEGRKDEVGHPKHVDSTEHIVQYWIHSPHQIYILEEAKVLELILCMHTTNRVNIDLFVHNEQSLCFFICHIRTILVGNLDLFLVIMILSCEEPDNSPIEGRPDGIIVVVDYYAITLIIGQPSRLVGVFTLIKHLLLHSHASCIQLVHVKQIGIYGVDLEAHIFGLIKLALKQLLEIVVLILKLEYEALVYKRWLRGAFLYSLVSIRERLEVVIVNA